MAIWRPILKKRPLSGRCSSGPMRANLVMQLLDGWTRKAYRSRNLPRSLIRAIIGDGFTEPSGVSFKTRGTAEKPPTVPVKSLCHAQL